MVGVDNLTVIEVGYRSGDSEYLVICSCRKLQLFKYSFEQDEAVLSRAAELFGLRRIHFCVAGDTASLESLGLYRPCRIDTLSYISRAFLLLRRGQARELNGRYFYVYIKSVKQRPG